MSTVCVITLSNCKTVTTKSARINPPITAISSMTEIDGFLKDADLVIFDIDHTILESTTAYCHSNWFYDHYEQAIKQGVNETTALNALLPPWEQSQKGCVVKAVETITPTLVQNIQASGKKVMALTTRSLHVADDTIAQLHSLGIDFSDSAPHKGPTPLLNNQVFVKNGIVFTSEYLAKGDVLKEYLKHAHLAPKNIVFVDDSMRNLVSVTSVLGQDDITVHAFHYPLVKRTFPEWDKAVADAEWEKRHGKIVFEVQ